ncbi:MAG: TDT family transporter [Methanobrevibacter sp.]|uniref:TDT family transporter n=1 Tax=Methanobrevibacter sp. TaxID=66852 RepID=UPI0025F4B049|nr:TDT family transporter [Methanobrevibacter sp.]MBE6508153.1 TDT family transporter [Methanobrevibacter sp.]
MNLIKKLPIPMAGLILAILSLGNLLQDINPHLRYLFGAIGVLLIVLMILKVILYPQNIKNDFKNPVIASSSGTFSMSLMLLSTYLIEFTPEIACAIWIIGISLHILLMIYFTYHFIVRNFDISTVYPSYWIVFVGITMGAITAGIHGLDEIGFICFLIGFAAMLVTLPLVIYRYIRYRNIPNMNKPLICIFTALISILIVGYLNSSPSPSKEFLTILYSIACIFYIFAFYKLIEYRNLEFYPSFSAFTFPFVISALATKGILKINSPNYFLHLILTIETAIALIIVIYVLIRYVKFLKK